MLPRKLCEEWSLEAFGAKKPGQYKLALICDRYDPPNPPQEVWTRDENGNLLSAQAKSMDGTTWAPGMTAVISPEAPDQYWIDAGLEYGIDPVYALAFFMHESTLGTNPAWSGFKPDGSTTHNVGNITCADYPTCYGRFRDYPNWQIGIRDWFRLIAVEYIADWGLVTVESIIPRYAPQEDNNDEPLYINNVKQFVAQWRQP
jgi:hypothetical protein